MQCPHCHEHDVGKRPPDMPYNEWLDSTLRLCRDFWRLQAHKAGGGIPEVSSDPMLEYYDAHIGADGKVYYTEKPNTIPAEPVRELVGAAETLLESFEVTAPKTMLGALRDGLDKVCPLLPPRNSCPSGDASPETEARPVGSGGTFCGPDSFEPAAPYGTPDAHLAEQMKDPAFRAAYLQEAARAVGEEDYSELRNAARDLVETAEYFLVRINEETSPPTYIGVLSPRKGLDDLAKVKALLGPAAEQRRHQVRGYDWSAAPQELVDKVYNILFP